MPSSKLEQDEYILKAVKWAARASEEIRNAGGSTRVLDMFSDESIITMVRNHIGIKYEGLPQHY